MTNTYSSGISQAQDDLYRKLNRRSMRAGTQVSRCSNTLENTLDPRARDILREQRLGHLRTQTDALVQQACIRKSISPGNIQSCFVTPASEQSHYQTIAALDGQMKKYGETIKGLYDKADVLSRKTDGPAKELERSELLTEYRTIVSRKADIKAAKRDTYRHYGEQREQDYTDIEKMPQTMLVKTMENDRLKIWEEKFIATLDGAQAEKDRLADELTDQLTSMNEVNAERRHFFADLKNGNLSSWAHSAPRGRTATSLPPTQSRTSTYRSTCSPASRGAAQASSSTGSVSSSAQQYTCGSSFGQRAQPLRDPSLKSLEARITEIVGDRNYTVSEMTDLIMAATSPRATTNAGPNTCGSQYMSRQGSGTGMRSSACA